MRSAESSTPNPPRGDDAAPSQAVGSTAAPLTPWQEKIFQRNREKLRRVNELVAQGYSRIGAASEARIAITTVWNLEKRLRDQGIAGLIPGISKGAPPIINPALFTPAVVSELQRLSVKFGGPRAAARAYANDPNCPPQLGDYIRSRDSIPERLRVLIGFRRYSRPIRLAGQFAHIEGLPVQPKAT
jgi:hypothetical protein